VRATLREVEALLAAGVSVAITDVRFDNEAAAVRAAGGRVFRVVRSGDSCLAAETAAHASEAGVSDALVDGVIVNSGSLDDLRDAVVEAILG
jgi:ribosomal protein S11